MKLLILDGNSIINRAFYGVRILTTRDGLPTNAVYGFLNILEKVQKEEKPDALCVAFDLHGPTFRHERYDGYKANRHAMPEELAVQMPVMKQVLAAMNIPIYACQGWEADDVIGTVSKICGNNGWDCVIVTGDRDSLQLIDDHVRVKLVITRPGQTTYTLYDEQTFVQEYGFAPKKIIDLKALMGDNSDNIPGIAGVGPKTASELLQKFGSLDGLYENIDDPFIRPKLREKLQQGKSSAYLSYELATIQLNAPIDFAPADAIVQPYNEDELFTLFQKLEFVRLIDKYHLHPPALPKEIPNTQFKKLTRRNQLPEQCEAFALYIAPDHSVGIAWDDGVYALTPMESFFLHEFLQQGKEVVCHDYKTTLHTLNDMALTLVDCCFDTALAAYDLNSSQTEYLVSKLAMNYLGISVSDEDALGCAEAIWNLKPVLQNELVRNGMLSLYDNIELPLCTVLYEMECAGVAIDQTQLAQFGSMLSDRISDCEKIIYDYAEEAFNINSTKQLGEILFEKLSLPVIKKTKSGYSTNADVLEKLKPHHPIIPAIMEYRMLTKLKSTYADGLLKVIDPDGRIRTTFQNLVTATGRLSSTEPNLQNIPVRNDLGAEIRKMFIPEQGNVLVDADYSQIELRVLAHIADDSAMQSAFINGLDIHTVTASQVFDVEPANVTPLQRRHAKAVNFGIVYGISEFSLADDIGVSRYEARAYIDSYLAKYSGVRAYMKQVVEDARKCGYTTTLYGRKRSIPELASSNYMVRQGAERIALNTPVQGTAADLIKLAMIQVRNALRDKFPSAKLILQVHDELIIECPEEIAEQVSMLVSSSMQQVAALKVPLIAEAKYGKSWYDAK